MRGMSEGRTFVDERIGEGERRLESTDLALILHVCS